MPVDEVDAAACRRRHGRDAEAVDPVPHRILVAVPIADHDRQARRHGLDRGQAEGLLDVVATAR